jgi:hypothetical protein
MLAIYRNVKYSHTYLAAIIPNRLYACHAVQFLLVQLNDIYLREECYKQSRRSMELPENNSRTSGNQRCLQPKRLAPKQLALRALARSRCGWDGQALTPHAPHLVSGRRQHRIQAPSCETRHNHIFPLPRKPNPRIHSYPKA